MTVLIPKLPQNDGSSYRQNKLNESREQYRYNYNHIPSLGISDSVPVADNPQLPWILEVIDTLFKTERNAVEVMKNTDLNFPPNDLEQRLEEIFNSVGVKEPLEILRDLLGLLEVARPTGRPRNIEDYQLLFQSREIPQAFNELFSDDHFAEMRVSGANPLVIKQVAGLDNRFPVTNEIFQATAPFADDTLEAAGSEGRLYLADYELFSTMNPGALPSQPKYVYTPLALFARPRHGDALKPVAIQCHQDPSSNPIFTPNDGWSWQLAKATVQVSDTNHHELVSHLGTTHLVLEAIGVSTHRQLSFRHPLFLLLVPHFEGTFFINNAAHTSLIPEGKPVPVLLTGDTPSLHQQAIDAVKNFSFRDAYLPVSLHQRGVDNAEQLPYYPYRDDALKIWNAIRDWVSEYLAIYYGSDYDVQQDSEVQSWAAEISSDNGGRLNGFGDGNGLGIGSLESLIDTATMIIFTGSAQHAAVNFPQKTQMAYCPIYPLAGYSPAPTHKHHTEEDFLNMFAPMDNAAEHSEVLTLLGSVYYTQLGQYTVGHFLDLRVAAPLLRFQAALRELEDQIDERNAGMEKPYTTLKPSLIPQSTNI